MLSSVNRVNPTISLLDETVDLRCLRVSPPARVSPPGGRARGSHPLHLPARRTCHIYSLIYHSFDQTKYDPDLIGQALKWDEVTSPPVDLTTEMLRDGLPATTVVYTCGSPYKIEMDQIISCAPYTHPTSRLQSWSYLDSLCTLRPSSWRYYLNSLCALPHQWRDYGGNTIYVRKSWSEGIIEGKVMCRSLIVDVDNIVLMLAPADCRIVRDLQRLGVMLCTLDGRGSAVLFGIERDHMVCARQCYILCMREDNEGPYLLK